MTGWPLEAPLGRPLRHAARHQRARVESALSASPHPLRILPARQRVDRRHLVAARRSALGRLRRQHRCGHRAPSGLRHAAHRHPLCGGRLGADPRDDPVHRLRRGERSGAVPRPADRARRARQRPPRARGAGGKLRPLRALRCAPPASRCALARGQRRLLGPRRE